MFFDDSTLDDYATVSRKGARRYDGPLRRIQYAPVDRTFVDPWTLPFGSRVVFDSEVFRNFYFAGFKHIDTGTYFALEQSPAFQIDRDALLRILFTFQLITFNGKYYDLPVAEAAIKGASTVDLKALSDDIIINEKRLANPNAKYNHIDLIEVAPLEASLKTYAGRLHARRMQELPVDVHKDLSAEDAADVRDYCFNDCDNTELLLVDKNGLQGPIDLRERLGRRYNIDLRSKSDAQVAEAVINAELKDITGYYPKRPNIDDFDGFTFQYEAPEWVQFQTPMLRDVLSIVQGASFSLDGGGSPKMPDELSNLKITIGNCDYKLGMGGLHSQEKSVAYRADEDNYLIDRDVRGYYPRIILNNRYYPEHLGPVYLEAYGDRIVEERDRLKKQKHPDADGMKIASNGIFGKQGNMYSTVYAPKLLIQTTIGGQLGLLLLIEAVELANFQVVSANTDGFVTKVPKARLDDFNAIIANWERITGFETEEARYAGLYSRDVNNYIAVKDDGSCKVKGAYSERGSALNSPLSKNPECLICSDAVQAFLTVGKSIDDTISECRDVRRFVVVRNVRGGAHKDGYYLGKVVRWYYATGVSGVIAYIQSGNKVPNSEGAKPLMELADFPADMNFEYYIERAYGILEDIGYFGYAKQKTLF